MTTLEDVAPAEHGADSAAQTRDAARKRLEAERGFVSDVVAYVVVNGLVICVWAFTGTGYFWPAWLLAAWSVGLLLHAWDVFGRRPITEADIDEELRRHPDRATSGR